MDKKQRIRIRNLIFVFLLFAFCFLPFAYFLSGCSSTPSNRLDAEVKAVGLNQKADSAFRNGNYKRALDFYGEALKVNSSIEHADGIAVNLMNMAVVYRKLGDRENAHKCVDEILNSRYIIFDPSYMSGAAFIKALLYVDKAEYPSAIEWTDKALSFCNSAKCDGKGQIYNLKAKIALINNMPGPALDFGYEGLQWNRKLEDRQEEANSLRLLADAKTAAKVYGEATDFYKEALTIDKDMGFSAKIATDLFGMGNALCMQGRQEEARGYFGRAESVSKSLGDNKGAALAEEMIGKCAK